MRQHAEIRKMTAARKDLQEALCHYTTETLTYIHTVKGFCEMFSKWMLWRETEVERMVHIKDRVDTLDLNISHVTKSEEKGEAFLKYMKNKVTVNVDSKRAELENELVEVLKNTMSGLENLHCFLDAVEKLAVTSLHVFMENQMLQLPKEISFVHVQAVIVAARLICPLLLEFKRDAKVFFTPKLQNVEELKCQLDRYIQTSQNIYAMFEKSFISDFDLKMNNEVQLDFKTYITESDTESMLCHVNQLQEIRMDPNFRMAFLFQEVSCSHFIGELNRRQPKMFQFLEDLEECAVQLDRMNQGAKISSVAGSSVGLVGGVLSIVGLALAPVTAGVSLGLIIGGGGLGILKGANSIVTTFTGIGVNKTQTNKANKVFQKFMEDMKSIQNCLQQVISQPTPKIKTSFYMGIMKGVLKLGKFARDVYLFSTDETMRNLIAHSASKMGSEIPEMSQPGFNGSLGLSKLERASSIGLNVLFIGAGVFFICKDSISLVNGNETEHSQFIRARAALWKSEMKSWQKICDSLNKGLKTSEKKKSVLDRPFYPEIN